MKLSRHLRLIVVCTAILPGLCVWSTSAFALLGGPIELSVYALAFGNQYVGGTSTAQTLVLSNPGDALLSINRIAASGHYASTTNCGATLAPGARCNINVTFTPSGTGVVGDVLTIDTGAASKTFLVSLSGAGVIDPAAPVMLDQSIRFGAAPVMDVGGSANVSATASSGLAVGLGNTTPEVCTISGNTVTGLIAGICTISAAQAGDAIYSAATPVVQSIAIKSTLSLAPLWNLLGNGVDASMAVATTFGDSSKVETVWKWMPEAGRWAFYTPTLSDGGAAFTASKGYDFLTTIGGGEGFWVKSKGLGTVSRPPVRTSCVKTVMTLELAPSWNLVSNNEVAPITMADTFNDANKVFAVWKWLPVSNRWAFYTPLQADHGAAYAAVKGYELLTTIERSEGFWVNANTAMTVPLPELPTSCLCDRAAKVDKAGNVVFPPEATETELPVDVDEDLGSVAALYPGLDSTTDAFYPDLPCGDQASIGGTLPTEVPDSTDQIDSENFLSMLEPTTGANILEQLRANPTPAVSLLSGFTMEGCFVATAPTPVAPGSRKPTPCDSAVFLDATMPFEGRDIIYVHGLDVNPIKVRIGDPFSNNALLATKVWPQDASEFLNAGGYFRTNAENYWRPHITEHLSTQDPLNLETGWQWGPADGALPIYKPKANRYLIVAWSANQTIEYAQHALLTQIQLAITSNKNVVTPPSYPAQNVRPFCANGCIIIGHSTGPLITSSAMGLARAGFFGPGGKEITRHIAAHISFAGAISGSRIASVAMALVSPLAVGPPPGLCNFMSGAFDVNFCAGDTSFIATGILRDLIPAVAQGVWGVPVEMSPVPTVTFAGGHPTGNQAIGLTGWWLPGVDDGVVTMNSACGNPNPVFPYVSPPSGMMVTNLLKAFEFSEWSPRLARGTSIRLAQRNLKMTPPLPGVPTDPFHFYLASACTPTLSASGMVMPLGNDLQWSMYDARRRYRNHYSFMQSLAEHSHDGGGSTPNAWPSSTQGPADAPHEYAPYVFPGIPTEYWGVNVEESRAVTDASIYTRMIDSNGTHLAKPLDMREIRRGRKVSFHMPFNLGNCQKQGFLRYYCTAWIWKRTYHLADKWERKQSSHYAYEYVGRR